MNERDIQFQNLMADVIPRLESDEERLTKSDSFNEYVKRNLSDIKALLIFLNKNKLLNCTDSYNGLNWGVAKGNRIKRLAMRLNMVTEETIQLSRGRGKQMNTLCVTERGYDLLNIEEDTKGKGSPLHKDYQKGSKERVEMFGIKAFIEYYKNGKNVDLGFQLLEKTWAVEMTLAAGTNEEENLQKDLKAGFDRIFFIVKDMKILDKVTNNLMRDLDDKDKDKVFVGLYEDFFTLIQSELAKG